MKKTIFNPLNILIILFFVITLVFINYRDSIKPFRIINSNYKDICSDKNTVTDKVVQNRCEKLEKTGSVLTRNFNIVHDRLSEATWSLFYPILAIFILASMIKFHRAVHSGFFKNILTRKSYQKFISEEIRNSFITLIFLYTIYMISIIIISYLTVGSFSTINISNIFIEYINTLLYLMLSLVLALILLPKFKNIIIHISIYYLSIMALSIVIFETSDILAHFVDNEMLIDLLRSTIKPLETEMKYYFMPAIIVNLIAVTILWFNYKKKEAFIIETEK